MRRELSAHMDTMTVAHNQKEQIKRIVSSSECEAFALLLTSLVKIFPKGAMVVGKPGAGGEKSWE